MSKKLPPGKKKWMVALATMVLLSMVAVTVGTRFESLGTNFIVGGVKLYAERNDLDPLTVYPLPERSVFLANDGTEIATLYLENRIGLPYGDIPQGVLDAIVAVEDKRFFEHDGVDPRAVIRAILSNVWGGGLQGGSTISQQYVKNILTTQAETPEAKTAAVETTVTRKLVEAWYANELERRLGKEQILEGYLNTVYFGEGAYGIGAAAERYFSTSAQSLTLSQAATLAGLVRGPATYNPFENPDRTLERRTLVLDAMYEQGYIGKSEYEKARGEPLTLKRSFVPNGCIEGPYPFFCEWVKATLEQEPALGASLEERKSRIAAGGLTIKTTLDPAMQKIADETVKRTVGVEDRVAVVSVTVEPGTGAVQAMAVNRNFGLDEEQRQTVFPLVSAEYQTGSTFKPFALATALESGWILEDVLPGGARYRTPAFDSPDSGGFTNPEGIDISGVTLKEATVSSVNTAYVQLAESVGVKNIAQTASRLGLRNLPLGEITDREGSLPLGSRESSPVDMAASYATFASGGIFCRPTGVAEIVDRYGSSIKTENDCDRVLSEPTAETVTSVLTEVVTRGTGTASQVSGHPVAGKTGTTENFGAAWFVGYTPQMVTAVWMGDPRGPAYPLKDVAGVPLVYGGTIPARVFSQVMGGLLEGREVQELPGENLLYVGEGIFRIPDLVGLEAEVAATRLRSLGIEVKGLNSGVVTGTVPAAGSLYDGGVVELLVGEP